MLEYDDKTKDKNEHVKLINNIVRNSDRIEGTHIWTTKNCYMCQLSIHSNESQDQNNIISEQIEICAKSNEYCNKKYEQVSRWTQKSVCKIDGTTNCW